MICPTRQRDKTERFLYLQRSDSKLVTPQEQRSLKRVSIELPEDLLEAIDARKEGMDVKTRGEVLTRLLEWMTKDPLGDT